MELIKLLKKTLLGFINGKKDSQILPLSVKRLGIYYLQNGAALIMGYLQISWATSIFHQVALLATMCFCLISTPACTYIYMYHYSSHVLVATRIRL